METCGTCETLEKLIALAIMRGDDAREIMYRDLLKTHKEVTVHAAKTQEKSQEDKK